MNLSFTRSKEENFNPPFYDSSRLLELSHLRTFVLLVTAVACFVTCQGTLSAQVEASSNDLSEDEMDLVSDLRNVWNTELDRLAETHFADSPAVPKSWGASFNQATEVAESYASVFAKWGAGPEQQASKTVERIKAVPLPIRNQIVIALERWRELLKGPKSLETWDDVSWQTLKPISLNSRGGDELRLLEDGSIIAQGDNPKRGYDLVYETDLPSIAALRLEALTDESLPNNGPGRGPNGVFAISGIKISITPSGENVESDHVSRIASAVADHEAENWPLTTDHWHIQGGAGKAHRAVFELEQPAVNESGFRISISHQDRNVNPPWDSQNLGRFRWSAAPASQSPQLVWLEKVLDGLDVDPWRSTLRDAIAARNVRMLLRLSSNLARLSNQPDIVQAEATEALMCVDNGLIPQAVLEQHEWNALQPAQLEKAIGFELRDDGVVLADSFSGSTGTHCFRLSKSDRPITALMLELISDESLDGGFADQRDEVFLNEIRFAIHAGSDSSSRQTLRVQRASTNRSRSSRDSVAQAVDGDLSTSWVFSSQGERIAALFLLESPVSVQDDAILCLEITYDESQPINRIRSLRVSTTQDVVNNVDPTWVAIDILRDKCLSDPSNYWSNLSLASVLRKTDLASAARYATAALALRPQNPTARIALAKVLAQQAMQEDKRIPDDVVRHVEFARENGATPTLLEGLASSIANYAWSFFGRKDREAIRYTLLAQKLNPSLADLKGQETWIRVFSNNPQLRSNIDLLTNANIALEAAPETNFWHLLYGAALFREGHYDEAISKLEAIAERFPGDNGLRLLVLAMAELRSGDLEIAKQRYRTAVAWMSTRPNAGAQLLNMRQELEGMFAEAGIEL